MDREGEFIKLLQQHQGIIYKVCRVYSKQAEDWDDMYQEIALQAWKSFSTFRGEARFSTWLYRVALNTAITQFRRSKKTAVIPEATEQLTTPASEPDPKEEKLQAMYRAIAELSGVDKAIVLLFLDDYPYEDIGQMMGITPNHVAVKMSRIKTKLQSLTQQSLPK
jgi:RNA polymerase sigma-70 factor (ECF subfamily)